MVGSRTALSREKAPKINCAAAGSVTVGGGQTAPPLVVPFVGAVRDVESTP